MERRERERKFLVSLYQEEWTPLLLSLAVGKARGSRGVRATDAC